ncbi:rhophilin-1 isoform X2 [Echinops telfairi]|uniref:Rhophilin-1 isoform X2 n=1 Tax=Echinops telfairi TaxID=9371 RepID=A0AC55DQG8_ECHTE|nr:rhophilin-1 isoform X2 [Echinops telfairi]
MILEERADSPGGEDSARLQVAGSDSEGCDLLTEPQHGHLQCRRAHVHQLIAKELRIRTGAENLYRATTNNQVRETVALELSYVNASLQLLKEELDGGCMDTPWLEGDSISIPMIPLGLKETKELDWSTPLKELISSHFGEDGASYEAELKELEAQRQAMRMPSRDQAGLELLLAYYQQLCFLEARFCSPAHSLGLLFHWYDSLTGIPAQQQSLAFEKGSVLFNIGALCTQIGARQDRSCAQGTRQAMEAFQQAAGAFSLLQENFSHAPSPDMSPASLRVLKMLMAAQAQECVFEGLSLPAPAAPHDGPAQLHLAQEAAQVAAEYDLVHRALAEPPARDCVPRSWVALVQTKAQYFGALAHFHTAVALCDSPGQVSGPPRAAELEPEECRRRGKAHLRRAILAQEEALRLHGLCPVPRQVDLLQAVVAQALRCSLAKYSELDREDDFFEVAEVPDVQPGPAPERDVDSPAARQSLCPQAPRPLTSETLLPSKPGRASRLVLGLSTLAPPSPPAKTLQKPQVQAPSFSKVDAFDIFHRLGPLSVFSAKNHWRLVGPVHVTRGEGGFGFTLRGDAPVLIAAVVPGGRAAVAGLKEGDYLVSLNGQPCRWWKHAQVVAQLRSAGDEGVHLGVVTMLPGLEPPSVQSLKVQATLAPRGGCRSCTASCSDCRSPPGKGLNGCLCPPADGPPAGAPPEEPEGVCSRQASALPGQPQAPPWLEP